MGAIQKRSPKVLWGWVQLSKVSFLPKVSDWILWWVNGVNWKILCSKTDLAVSAIQKIFAEIFWSGTLITLGLSTCLPIVMDFFDFFSRHLYAAFYSLLQPSVVLLPKFFKTSCRMGMGKNTATVPPKAADHHIHRKDRHWRRCSFVHKFCGPK